MTHVLIIRCELAAKSKLPPYSLWWKFSLYLIVEQNDTFHIAVFFIDRAQENLLAILVIGYMRDKLAWLINTAFDQFIGARQHLGVMGICHGRKVENRYASQMPTSSIEFHGGSMPATDHQFSCLFEQSIG
jgi:hypothetical protein